MKYWIWYTKLNIKPYTKYKLLMKYKLPEKVFNLSKEDLIKNNLHDLEIKEFLKNEYKENLKLEKNFIERNSIKLITIYDKKYPQNLKKIYDPPIALYLLGNENIFSTNTIAIVGSRDCSKYGEIVSKKISFELAKNNITVVSGLAKGIDSFSHIGSIIGKGKTIAVLGNGLDIMYPKENKQLARKIINSKGTIITEYPIGTKPNKENFPQRNRIISGISNSIIVVEAKEKSGSLITVDFGLEQGKEVYAVPGNITNKNSTGTNELIREGANILTKIEDII